MVKVKALRLADVRSSGNGQVHHLLLADLPDSLIDVLDVLGNLFDCLHTTVIRNDLILDLRSPKVKFDKVSHEVLVDADEFT